MAAQAKCVSTVSKDVLTSKNLISVCTVNCKVFAYDEIIFEKWIRNLKSSIMFINILGYVKCTGLRSLKYVKIML